MTTEPKRETCAKCRATKKPASTWECSNVDCPMRKPVTASYYLQDWQRADIKHNGKDD